MQKAGTHARRPLSEMLDPFGMSDMTSSGAGPSSPWLSSHAGSFCYQTALAQKQLRICIQCVARAHWLQRLWQKEVQEKKQAALTKPYLSALPLTISFNSFTQQFQCLSVKHLNSRFNLSHGYRSKLMRLSRLTLKKEL